MSHRTGKKAKLAAFFYFFSLACIIAFGLIYFVPYGGNQVWALIISVWFFFTTAYGGVYYCESVWKKLGAVLIFGSVFGLLMYIGYDDFALSPERIDLLIGQMQDPDASVRESATISLRKEPISDLTRPRVVGALIDAVKDENDTVRRHAAYSLGEIGDPVAVDALIEVLKDENSWVRTGAIDA